MRNLFLSTVIVLASLWGITPACADEGDPQPVPRTETRNDYELLISGLLPQFNPSLLAPQPGPNWMAGKTVHEIAQAVGDMDPATILSLEEMTIGHDAPDGPRYFKLDFRRGYIRYTNRERSFHQGNPCGVVSEMTARSVFNQLMNALNLPPGEREGVFVEVVMERSVDGEVENSPEATCEVESMVTLHRQLPNGLPVFDSRARASISNLGTCARFLIQWPRFELANGLVMRTREEVIDDLTNRIWQAESDGTNFAPELDLNIRLGYTRTPAGHVPVALAAFATLLGTNAGLLEAVPLARNPNSAAPPSDFPSLVQLQTAYDAQARKAIMEFYLPDDVDVKLSVLDVTGREVRNLSESRYASGWHRIDWDLRGRDGQPVPAGMYFVKLQAGSVAPTRKLIVIQ